MYFFEGAILMCTYVLKVICESLKYNGLITSLPFYPVKYLNVLFMPYGSFLETNILLTSISSILNLFLFS